MTSDQDRLAGYIETWERTVDDTLRLLRSLDDEDWSRPTDLPGWDIHAVAAHLAHLESELSGVEQTTVEVPALDHIRSPMGAYTEMGPRARADWTPAQIVDELSRTTQSRATELRENPPTDGSSRPPITPGGIGWSWETLLRNRPFDVWMHEQDIRRAVGRPGGQNTPGAAHAVHVLTRSFPFSVGKRVSPPAGTTVVLEVRGDQPVHLAVEVNPGGRAVPMTSDPANPTTRLRMDTETFIILGGGRRSPADVEVQVEGDQELGRRILDAMAVTP